MKEVLCNFLDCVAGMGVAGNGQCFLGGDSSNKSCPRFQLEPADEAIEAMMARDKRKEVVRFNVKEIDTPVGRVWGGYSRHERGELVFYSAHKEEVTNLETELEAAMKGLAELNERFSALSKKMGERENK